MELAILNLLKMICGRINEIFKINGLVVKTIDWKGSCINCIFNKKFCCNRIFSDGLISGQCSLKKNCRENYVKFIKYENTNK